MTARQRATTTGAQRPVWARRRLQTRLLLRFLCLVSLLACTSAARAQYTFTILADNRPGSQFDNFFAPTINQRGEVVFAANLRSGGAGIYRWGGVPQQSLGTIYEEAVPTNLIAFESPAISADGVVTFQLAFDGVDTVMAGVPGGPLSVVADPSTVVPPVLTPGGPSSGRCEAARLVSRSIDSSGRAVVFCRSTGGYYLAGGGSFARVCDLNAGGPCFGGRLDQDFVEVSATGTLAGLGMGASQNVAGLLVPRLIRTAAQGATILLDAEVDPPGFRPAIPFLPAINDRGTIAFNGQQPCASIGTCGVIFRIDSAFQPIPFTDENVYRLATAPSISNSGRIAFVDVQRGGLFTGPDPFLDKVVVRGDSLPCSVRVGGQPCISPGNYTVPSFLTTVGNVVFQHPGISSAGQFVFMAELGGGLQAIVRAEPPNAKPVVNNPGDQFIEEGVLFIQNLTASDLENDIPFTWIISIPSTLGLSGTSDGLISGAPLFGTTDQSFTVDARVMDSRNAVSDPVQFDLTVTPARRTGLIATANPNSTPASIELRWTNPSPDSAASIEVEVVGVSVVRLGAGATSYRFVGVQERNYCFIVRGVSAGGLRSPDSLPDCEDFPTLRIDNVISYPTANDVTITWTTSLPATIVSTALTPAAVGGTTELRENEARTGFTYRATGLPASTPHNLHIVAESSPGLLFAAADAPFTTRAAEGGGEPGESQPGDERLQTLNLTITPTLYSLRFEWRTPHESRARIDLGVPTGTGQCNYNHTEIASSAFTRGQTSHSALFTNLTHTTDYCYRIVVSAPDGRGGTFSRVTLGLVATLTGRPRIVVRLPPGAGFVREADNRMSIEVEVENIASPTTVDAIGVVLGTRRPNGNIDGAEIHGRACFICSEGSAFAVDSVAVGNLGDGQRTLARIVFPLALDSGGGETRFRPTAFYTYDRGGSNIPAEDTFDLPVVLPLASGDLMVAVEFLSLTSDALVLAIRIDNLGEESVVAGPVTVVWSDRRIRTYSGRGIAVPIPNADCVDRAGISECGDYVRLRDGQGITYPFRVIIPNGLSSFTAQVLVWPLVDEVDPIHSNNTVTVTCALPWAPTLPGLPELWACTQR